MDMLKLQKDVKALESLARRHLENVLKLVSFELCDLPDDVLVLLDKCVEIHAQSHLNTLNLNYLREFYYSKKREYIENKLIVAQQSETLSKLKNSIDEAEKDIGSLERFTNTVNKRLISVELLQRNMIQIDGKSKSLLYRQKVFKVPDDFNIESVIEKIDMLERLK